VSKFTSLVEQRFNNWLVVSQAPSRKGDSYWLCRCDCGTEREVIRHGLTRGKSLSCGCLYKSGRVDITGETFGMLQVIKYSHSVDKKAYWDCICECGNVSKALGAYLRNGTIVSCGCYKKTRLTIESTTHGKAARGKNRSPEYNAWANAKKRCFDPNCNSYHLYGGRGITMSPEWINSFEGFYAHMGDRPEGFSLDRIDGNGNYEPGNCRWASAKEQARNVSTNIHVEYGEQSYTLAGLAEKLGLGYHRLHKLYRVKGLPLKEAITRCRQIAKSRGD